jgi:phage FluMu protein Com
VSEQEKVFDITELANIGWCRRCKTEIIFNAQTADYKENKCPNCGEALYPLNEILAAFQTAFRKATESKLHIRVRSRGKPSETLLEKK